MVKKIYLIFIEILKISECFLHRVPLKKISDGLDFKQKSFKKNESLLFPWKSNMKNSGKFKIGELILCKLCLKEDKFSFIG